MTNTIGLGEYKDEDLIEELKNRGVILYTEKELELAKIDVVKTFILDTYRDSEFFSDWIQDLLKKLNERKELLNEQ